MKFESVRPTYTYENRIHAIRLYCSLRAVIRAPTEFSQVAYSTYVVIIKKSSCPFNLAPLVMRLFSSSQNVTICVAACIRILTTYCIMCVCIYDINISMHILLAVGMF